MVKLEGLFVSLSNLIWSNWLIALLILVGIYLGFITKFFHIRKLPQILYITLIKPLKNKEEIKGQGNTTSFQALCTALGSCVGNGNIVGVATAIVAGGPGAVIWMWIAAIVGMATKYSEILLGIEYREKRKDGTYISGPMNYIEKGLKLKRIALLYGLLLFIQNAGGTLIQANTIAVNCYSMFNIGSIATAIILIFLIRLIIIGGIKRIATVTQKVVPFMTFFYIIGGMVVILFNISSLPSLFVAMIRGAFSLEAGIGGAIGYSIRESMRYGVARGLYSNEAGEGTAAVFHASAIVDHPGKQAIFGIAEVFVDTIVICSITAFVVLSTGVIESGEEPTVLVSLAFGSVHPIFRYIVGLSSIVFGFFSMVGQWYLGNTALEYIKGNNKNNVEDNKKNRYYKYIFLLIILIGCSTESFLVWLIQDCILGLLIIPNIISILLLSRKVKKRTMEFLMISNLVD